MKLWLALLLCALPAAAAERTAPAVDAPSRAAAIEPPAYGLTEGPASIVPSAAPAAAAQAAASADSISAPAAAPAVIGSLTSSDPGAKDGAGRFGEQKLRIIHVAAELVPFVKKGGLGEVAGMLARNQATLGHDVTNIVPRSASFDSVVEFEPLPVKLRVRVGDRVVETGVSQARLHGVRILRLENELFDRRDIYDQHDMGERFIALPRAALEAASALGLRPDILHFHDWHAALGAPMTKLAVSPAVDPEVAKAKTVLTAHNAGYGFQGWYPLDFALKAGFSPDELRWDSLAHKDHFNYLKAGFQYADAITTVSLNHRHELLQWAAELESVLQHRADRFFGFPNPVNPALHPSRDPKLFQEYDLRTAMAGKAANKTALQKELGLPVDADIPMFVVASRLNAGQKGMDLVLAAAPVIAAKGGQLVVQGVGDPEIVSALEDLQRRYPRNIVFRNSFGAPGPLYAAGDFLLMPSRYEPGGLSNAEAQAYGAKPIVTPVGGMVDRTLDIRRHPEGDGFVMTDVSADSLIAAVQAAFAHFSDKAALERSTRMAMRHERAWDGVREYLALYRRLLTRAD